MYQDVLGSLSSQGSPPPPSQGVGPPPDMPGLPPAPTMMGAMPTGTKNLDAKGAADQAVLALREATGFFPNLAGDLNAIINKLVDAGKPPAGPGPSVTAPGPAAIAGSSTAPTMESGSPGAQ